MAWLCAIDAITPPSTDPWALLSQSTNLHFVDPERYTTSYQFLEPNCIRSLQTVFADPSILERTEALFDLKRSKVDWETNSYSICASRRSWESFCCMLGKVGENVVVKLVAGFCDYVQTKKQLSSAVLTISVPDKSLIIERAFLVHDTVRILLRWKVLTTAKVVVYSNVNDEIAIAVVAPEGDLLLATDGLTAQLDVMGVVSHNASIEKKILDALTTPLRGVDRDKSRLAMRQISAFAIAVSECLPAKHKGALEAASICSLEEPTEGALESAEAMRCHVVAVITLDNKSIASRLKLLKTLWCKSPTGRLSKHPVLSAQPLNKDEHGQVSEFVQQVMCTVFGASSSTLGSPGSAARPVPMNAAASKSTKLTRFPLIAPTRVDGSSVPIEKRQAFVRSVFVPLATREYTNELLSTRNIQLSNFSFRMDERLRSVSPGWLSSMSCQSPTSLASHTAQPSQQQRPNGTPASAAHVDFDALLEELNTRGGTAHAQDAPAPRQAPPKSWKQLLNFNLLDKGQL